MTKIRKMNCRWCGKELSPERIRKEKKKWKTSLDSYLDDFQFICKKCDEIFKNHPFDYALPFVESYFIEKLYKYDKKAAEYILKGGYDPWERYKELWTIPINPIWIKGRKFVFLKHCCWSGLINCSECEKPLKFNEFVLHHPYYDFEHIFSTAKIVCKKCHKKGTQLSKKKPKRRN